MSFNQHIWSKQEVISGAGKRVWECQHSCIPSTNIHCLPETAPLGSLYALAAAESLSRVRFFATPWTAAHQAPLAMGFSRQEYWSGVPSPSPICAGEHVKPTPVLMLLLFSGSVVSDALWPHGLQHTRLPCPSPSPRVCSTHVHWVDDAIQPSHPLSPPSHPVLNLSQHQVLYQWVSSSHQVVKVLEL